MHKRKALKLKVRTDKAIPHVNPVSVARVTATAATVATVRLVKHRPKVRLQKCLHLPKYKRLLLLLQHLQWQTLASSPHAAATLTLLRLKPRQSKRLLLHKCKHLWPQHL